jgi:predicted N-acetyltransferase YhbS
MKPQRLPVSKHSYSRLSQDQRKAVWRLVYTAFPPKTESLEERVELSAADKDLLSREAFVVWEGDVALANATVFERMVETVRGPLEVMALAAVCCAPVRRGEGLGALVVSEAFKEVDAGKYPVSLFQTGVPKFYEKLGARLVDNAFVNSLHDPADRHGSADAPWWEPHIMIYPATYDWPTGTVDLLGPGF